VVNACAVSQSLKHPLEYKFHIGNTDETLPIDKWDMTYPEVILNQNPIEQCHVWNFFYNSLRFQKAVCQA